MASSVLAATEALPLTLPPPLPDPPRIRIFRTRGAYEQHGGQPHAAGMFIYRFPRDPGEIIIPAESLGLDAPGHRTAATDHVLRHEMAHQATAGVLPLLPQWLREGIAELIARSPADGGTLDPGPDAAAAALRRRFNELQTIGEPIDPLDPAKGRRTHVPLSDLEAYDRDGWHHIDPAAQHALYFTAHALTYWFLHLDGDGQARHLRAAFDHASRAMTDIRTREARRARIDPATVQAEIHRILLAGRTWNEIDTQMRSDLKRRGVILSPP